MPAVVLDSGRLDRARPARTQQRSDAAQQASQLAMWSEISRSSARPQLSLSSIGPNLQRPDWRLHRLRAGRRIFAVLLTRLVIRSLIGSSCASRSACARNVDWRRPAADTQCVQWRHRPPGAVREAKSPGSISSWRSGQPWRFPGSPNGWIIAPARSFKLSKRAFRCSGQRADFPQRRCIYCRSIICASPALVIGTCSHRHVGREIGVQQFAASPELTKQPPRSASARTAPERPRRARPTRRRVPRLGTVLPVWPAAFNRPCRDGL